MAHITFRETGTWERLGAQNSICKANMYVATILCLVTCVEEAIFVNALCCCLWVFEVPLHDLRSPYPDLTILIWAQRLPCLDIHNLEGRQIGLGGFRQYHDWGVISEFCGPLKESHGGSAGVLQQDTLQWDTLNPLRTRAWFYSEGCLGIFWRHGGPVFFFILLPLYSQYNGKSAIWTSSFQSRKIWTSKFQILVGTLYKVQF